jgi:hypothetical protein
MCQLQGWILDEPSLNPPLLALAAIELVKAGSRRLKEAGSGVELCVGRGKAERYGMRGSLPAPLPHTSPAHCAPSPLSYHLHQPGTCTRQLP